MKFYLYLVLIFSSYTLGAQQRFALPCGRLLNELSVQIAISQVGVTNAKNPAIVKEYLRVAGVGYYNPFCASGQYWCKVKASQTVDYINTMFGTKYDSKLPYPRSAMANAPFNYAKKHGKQTAYKPEISDYLIWYVAMTPSGHIEMVIKILPAGWVECVGFNTGNREVKITKRNLYSPIGRKLVRGLVGFKESNDN